VITSDPRADSSRRLRPPITKHPLIRDMRQCFLDPNVQGLICTVTSWLLSNNQRNAEFDNKQKYSTEAVEAVLTRVRSVGLNGDETWALTGKLEDIPKGCNSRHGESEMTGHDLQ